MKPYFLEYIWIDGSESAGLRSKIRVAAADKSVAAAWAAGNVTSLPNWSFDGSSTGQATGSDSDCILRPVAVRPNPLMKNSFIVLS